MATNPPLTFEKDQVLTMVRALNGILDVVEDVFAAEAKAKTQLVVIEGTARRRTKRKGALRPVEVSNV